MPSDIKPIDPGTPFRDPHVSVSAEFNTQRHLAREVLGRRDEYTRAKQIRVKTGSWNVASCAGTEKDIKGWFVEGKGISSLHGGLPIGNKTNDEQVEDVPTQEARASKHESTIPINDAYHLPSNDEIDIYALGLQEIVDINSAAEALRPYNDSAPATRWKEAMAAALPEGYVLVAEQQCLGLLLLVYASPSIASTISSVSTTSVGTGLMGYMANKGAVAARLVLGQTTKMVFVNCHLAAGNDKASLERRNWDVSQIIQRTRFSPIDHGNGVMDELGDYIGEEDFAFWFGDLNYRLSDIPGDDVRRLLLLHTRNEYGQDDKTRQIIDRELKLKEDAKSKDVMAGGEAIEPSMDPASPLTTIASLMIHDQLHAQMRLRKAFHEGWQEGPIQFLPTYKYDIGSVGMFDSSEKRRSPSWCDRILYRTKKHYQYWRQQAKELEKVHKRDEEMKARGLEKENAEDIIFDYDPETDGDDGVGDDPTSHNNESNDTPVYQEVATDSVGSINLEYYVSHQRILSSDHKPLAAIFDIQYNAVDAELKSRIYQDVAKEIDRQENEGRPSVTAIFESQDLHEKPSDGCQFGDLRFFQEKTVLLTVANTSPVPATFEFVQRDGVPAIPLWMRLEIRNGPRNTGHNNFPDPITLQPGDSANIDVVASVHQAEQLYQFNEGSTKPDAVLVMRVYKGRDHFIPVQANWLPSCFGLSIDRLIRIGKDGVRKQRLDRELDKEVVKSSAPRELFRLTESLEKGLSNIASDPARLEVMRQQNLGWPFVCRPIEEIARDDQSLSIREALDTGSPIELPNANSIEEIELLSETLVLFLSYMSGQIVPLQLWDILSVSLVELEKARRLPQDEQLRSHVLDVLSTSPPASISFTFITFMLSRFVTIMAPVDDALDSAGPLLMLSTPGVQDSILKRARGLSLRDDQRGTRKRQIETAYVERFMSLIFEMDDSLKGTRARKISFDMKKLVLEAFILNRKAE